ncbi:hypothetical protein GCM10009541_23880 [Micromonospora gifhornensis]|uniref:Protein-L-isoaspartate O-methyltransferase n=1 Tax=Micromonospora gifhornensis TaxID=84594 RepID=A0ABQ4IH43_9ACTN|nr:MULTISPECIES: methyltransferase domain-containing protein [Micromonospora]PMR61263.1 protein-L-isoaspartate(D-aspartate) O-methyltransferase [Verrucosispora sp. ts21]GIJ17231.1 hypothetical protein Vgi01_39150 [Micromonospora gifhornensis]
MFGTVPERHYVHNEQRGETLHRSAAESIQREVIALDVPEGARVLEIGTGTGYSGALLAALTGTSGRVTSVDISDHLVGWANRLHRQRGLTTITCHVADGLAGYLPHAPYQRLVAWCTPPRLPRAWVDQVTADGRIVACLPVAAQPSTTVITSITLAAGTPRVDTLTFGGYAQSTTRAVPDALTVPGRWVDHVRRQPGTAWLSIGWRDRDDRQHTGARAALDLLLRPGHTETYAGSPLDWLSWTVFSVIVAGRNRSVVALPPDGVRGIGHTTASSAAVILTDSTIIADSPRSPSLAALRSWLDRWEHAGRPAATWYEPTLTPNDDEDLPGWDLTVAPRTT